MRNPLTKNNIFRLALPLLLFICISPTLTAQHRAPDWDQLLITPKTYVIYKTGEAITIDGLPTESSWEAAGWTDRFEDIEGAIRPAPAFETKVKMLYDDQYLYLYAYLEEPHIWGTLVNHDDIIYHDNDFEVFLQNMEFADYYYELEINVLNTLFDLFMPKTYRSGGRALTNWDAKGIKTAVYHEGTLNDPSDTDSSWAVEMAIPFTSISTYGQKATPSPADTWRINFSRVQWQHEIIDGRYQRKQGSPGMPLPENNWVWSPQGVVDMHYPERWGYIQFSGTPPEKGAPTSFLIPEKEAVKRKAWLIYYLQQHHRREQHHYAAELASLQEYYTPLDKFFEGYHVTLSAGNDWFVAKVHPVHDGQCYSINQHGQLRPSRPDDAGGG